MKINIVYDSTIPEDQIWMVNLKTGEIHKIINTDKPKQSELNLEKQEEK